MDLIDEQLTKFSHDHTLSPTICAGIAIAKQTLNRYYELTDSSDVYHIAMGESTNYEYIVHLKLFAVLHPRHKGNYFKLVKWEDEWVQTAKKLVCNRFEQSYAAEEEYNSDIEVTEKLSMSMLSQPDCLLPLTYSRRISLTICPLWYL
jgi:hypothetical protein